MTRRILNKSSPGSATDFGSDDFDQNNKLLTGVDQSGTDPVDINTTFKFRSSKAQIANPANTFKFILAGDTIGADRTVTLGNIMEHPESRRVGGYYGGLNTSLHGICAGSAQQAATGTPTIAYTTDTGGKYTKFTTGATIGNTAGLSLGTDAAAGVMRGLNTRFKCKFRLNTTATTRIFIGLKSATGALTGDTPIAATSGYLLHLSSGGTNFVLFRNSAGTAVSSTIAAADTNTHTIELRTIAGDTGWEYSYDGSAYTQHTSGVMPASTTVLYPIVWIETNSAAAKNMDVWWWILETSS